MSLLGCAKVMEYGLLRTAGLRGPRLDLAALTSIAAAISLWIMLAWRLNIRWRQAPRITLRISAYTAGVFLGLVACFVNYLMVFIGGFD